MKKYCPARKFSLLFLLLVSLESFSESNVDLSGCWLPDDKTTDGNQYDKSFEINGLLIKDAKITRKLDGYGWVHFSINTALYRDPDQASSVWQDLVVIKLGGEIVGSARLNIRRVEGDFLNVTIKNLGMPIPGLRIIVNTLYKKIECKTND